MVFPLAVLALAPTAAPAQNVILMIGDGAGYSQFQAAAMADGRLGREIFDGRGWVRVSASTYPLRLEKAPGGSDEQDPSLAYTPERGWNRDDQYKWLKDTPTDSGASASAMATGRKVYKHSICWSDKGEKLANLGDLFRQAGKSVGVATSVEWSDATPAAMLAHNVSRDNRAEIAREMVEKSGAAVIMGACHPWYDGSGVRLTKPADTGWTGDRYFLEPEAKRNGVRFIETKEEFEDLAKGRLDMLGCTRLVGTARAAAGLQIERATKDWDGDGKATRDDIKAAPLNGDPLVATTPTLSTMAMGALRLVSQNKKGFFLMIEGGAIDHAGHYNWPARNVEEAQAFFRTIEDVAGWIERNGGWKKNLLIVTADHETGGLWGPESDSSPFQPLASRGRGRVPGMKFNSGGHTNVLIPLYARGAGAERLIEMAKGQDPVRGAYADNTDVFRLIAPSAAQS